MALLVVLKTQKSEVTKYIDEKEMIRNDDWQNYLQQYWAPFYYKNPSLW